MQTIELTVEEPLLAAVDRASRELAMTRADFARLAFELALRHQNILALEQKHAQGYAQNPPQPDEFDGWETEQVWGEA